jgi:hypothetical protein
MKCYEVSFCPRNGSNRAQEIADILEDMSIRRERPGKIEFGDLASLIFSLQDRIEKLESRT